MSGIETPAARCRDSESKEDDMMKRFSRVVVLLVSACCISPGCGSEHQGASPTKASGAMAKPTPNLQTDSVLLKKVTAMLTFKNDILEVKLSDFTDSDNAVESKVEIRVWSSNAGNDQASRRRVLKATVEQDMLEDTIISYTAPYAWSDSTKLWHICLHASYSGKPGRDIYGEATWSDPTAPL